MRALLSKSHITRVGIVLLMLMASTSLNAEHLPDFTELVTENSPSVVNISTREYKSVRSRLRNDYRIPDLSEDGPWNGFFHHFFRQRPEGRETPKRYNAQSLGSGFIISEDGYILTNYHVVKGADEILVRLNSRQEYLAKIIGIDKRSDVALLKIEAKELPKVKIQKDDDLKVGEWVLAIGSPFGFDHSVTAGIVSAKGRSLPSENYVPFIQTDVAINPGNSGGPLFNLKGEVVGINSQIYSQTGGFMGLSFAIPISMAMNVAEQLKEKGSVSRGWLGVLIQDVTRELADSFGMKHPRGALIARVLPDSPAEKAGLVAGDIILEYNGEQLHSSTMLPPLVGSSRIDRDADVLILRNGKRKTINVSIGELPEEDENIEKASRGSDLLGIDVIDITSTLQKQFKLETNKGVLVEKVSSGPAQAADIRQGDVIQMINYQRVDSVQAFEAQLEKLPRGRTVAVLVFRRSGPMFLALQVPEE